MRRTETLRATTLRELVDTLFESELRDAERAFLTANPELRDLETIPAGTTITLPADIVVVDSAADREAARSNAIVRLVGLLGDEPDAVKERLADAERMAKDRLGRADELKQQEDDVAERVWQDLTRLVTVARREPVGR
jgi:hypothetical protein